MSKCVLCGKEVEGELQLQKHSVNYMLDNLLEHSCRTDEWYKARSNKAKSSNIERAVQQLILHPRDAKAAAVLEQFKAEKLLSEAGKPGVAGLAAAGRLLREYADTSEEVVQVERIMLPEDMAARLKDTPVEFIESAPKPVSKPVSETADEPQETDWEPPILVRDGEMLATHLDVHVMALADGRLLTYDPHYKPRERGPYG